MKKLFYALLIPGCLQCAAQNLVPNPSFEDMVACPTTPSLLPPPFIGPLTVTSWTAPTAGTSDYFNVCANSTPFPGNFVGVPNNFAGKQTARTGDAYTGGYCLYGLSDIYREYIQAPLISPLVAGHHYFAGYWLSLAEGGIPPATLMSNISANDRMAIYFGLLPENRSSDDPMLDLIPQIETAPGAVFSDTLNWANVSGTFTAAGGEAWIIIGNFQSASVLTVDSIKGDVTTAYSYYYYDDVCVLDMDGPATSYLVHDTVVCDNEPIQLKGRDGAYSYYWNDGSTASGHTVTGTGTYWVKTVDPATCTIYADSFHLTQPLIPPPTLGNDTLICAGMPITLDASGPDYLQYYWSTGATTSSITVTQPGKYRVTVTTRCSELADSIEIRVPPAPVALLPADTLLCEGIPLPIRAGEQPDMSYTWSTGATGCCIVADSAGIYILTASNICGTSASDDIHIGYANCSNCVLTPTAFSPNDDGLNDKYTPLVNCTMKSYTLKIFNRWGQVVFESHTPGEGWNGTVKGLPAETGVYFYYLRAVPVADQAEKTERKGDITLFR